MIIKGSENSIIHVTKHDSIDKYLVLVEKQIKEGFHTSAKVIVDQVHSYDDGSHSMEISGVHYALCPEIDFFSMVDRISKSRTYRKYKTALQVAA